MGRKRSVKRRNGRRRGRKAMLNCTVITSLASLAGNEVSSRNLTLQQLTPDFSVTRDIVVDRVVLTFVNSSAVGSLPGASAQVVGVGSPWSAEAGDGFASSAWRSLRATGSTTLVLRPQFSAQRMPVQISRAGTYLRISQQSLLAATSSVTINIYFRMLVDDNTTVIV